jgi:hypothetical protein
MRTLRNGGERRGRAVVGRWTRFGNSRISKVKTPSKRLNFYILSKNLYIDVLLLDLSLRQLHKTNPTTSSHDILLPNIPTFNQSEKYSGRIYANF